MINYDFLSSVDRITSSYLNNNLSANSGDLDADIKQQFGAKFEEAYDSLQAMKMLNSTMHNDYSYPNKDSLREHASRLGYSIDNRVIDMLRLSVSDEMNLKVSSAIHNAANSLL